MRVNLENSIYWKDLYNVRFPGTIIIFFNGCGGEEEKFLFLGELNYLYLYLFTQIDFWKFAGRNFLDFFLFSSEFNTISRITYITPFLNYIFPTCFRTGNIIHLTLIWDILWYLNAELVAETPDGNIVTEICFFAFTSYRALNFLQSLNHFHSISISWNRKNIARKLTSSIFAD